MAARLSEGPPPHTAGVDRASAQGEADQPTSGRPPRRPLGRCRRPPLGVVWEVGLRLWPAVTCPALCLPRGWRSGRKKQRERVVSGAWVEGACQARRRPVSRAPGCPQGKGVPGPVSEARRGSAYFFIPFLKMAAMTSGLTGPPGQPLGPGPQSAPSDPDRMFCSRSFEEVTNESSSQVLDAWDSSPEGT